MKYKVYLSVNKLDISHMQVFKVFFPQSASLDFAFYTEKALVTVNRYI